MTNTIADDYAAAVAEARRALAALPFACNSPDKVRGLNGWVFEQILLSRIEIALTKRGIEVPIQQQVAITGRATVDFVIGTTAVEAKVSGTYDDCRAKYRRYRKAIEARGWHYLYVTLEETYEPNVLKAEEVFGKDRAFFLDRPDEFSRLIETIARLEEGTPNIASHRILVRANAAQKR